MDADRFPSMGPWTPEQDKLLTLAVEKHKGRNWKQVAEMVPGRTPIQCYQRVKRTLQPGMVKGHWTQLQDKQLIKIMGTINGDINWQEVAKKMGDRTAMQCRMRWVNHLNPAIVRNSFSKEEDEILLNEYAKHPQQWRLIAQALQNRTEDMVRKRYGELKPEGIVKSDSTSSDDRVQAASSLTKLNTQELSNQSFISANQGNKPPMLAPLPPYQPSKMMPMPPVWPVPQASFPTMHVQTQRVNPQSEIALLEAVKLEDLPSIIQLTKTGATSNDALYVAAEKGHLDVVAMLITTGAHVDYKEKSGKSPLHFAAANGHDKIVNLLLAAGASVDVDEKEGNTPLHAAALHGHMNVISMLLSKGASVATPNKDGRTPLAIAMKNGYDDIAKLLQEALYPKIERIKASDLFDLELLSTNNLFKVEKGLFKGQSVRVETLLSPNEYALEKVESYAKVQSSYIVPLLAYVAESPIKVVMPNITQGNLREHLDKLRPVDSVFPSRNEVAYALAKALEDLHEKQVVHHDLTSSSIVRWSDSWKLKLSCFGRSKEANTHLTVESVESMLWSAPEVITNDKYTYASDIYSFGIILSELDTLKKPYEGSPLNSFGLMLAISKGEAQVDVRDNCEPWYRELVLRCLNKNPSLRPKASELVQAFSLVLHEPQVLKKHSPTDRGLKKEEVLSTNTIAGEKGSDINGLLRARDIDIRDVNGLTPLHLAVMQNSLDIVKLLISSNANVNLVDKDGYTPLALAIKSGNRKMAKVIHGATTNPIIQVDNTSLSIAENVHNAYYKGHYNGELVLVKKGIREDDLRNEIDVLKKCSSPYIIRPLAVADVLTPKPKIIFEFMDGGNLRNYLDAKLKTNETTLNFTPMEIAWVIANALADLHRHEFIHRDLKSENVLLCSKNYIKLADFGYSRSLSTVSTSNPGGSLIWMAPEVIAGEDYSYAADVYSFGVILTELDTLQVPFSDSNLTPFMLLQSISTGELKPSLSTTCSAWYKDLVQRCLAFDPSERPTAEEIVDFFQKRLMQDQDDVDMED